MKNIAQKHNGLSARRASVGYTFVIHWILGLILFFVVPVLQSLWYSFCMIDSGEDGLIETTFNGLEHYKQILTQDPNYLNNLRDSIGKIGYSLPIVLALSLFLAVIINQKFPGRTLFRGVFFLPVIIASGIIFNMMTGEYIKADLFVVSSGAEYSYGGLIDFNQILYNLNMPDKITSLFSRYLGNVFSLIWSCGVQVILFLAGLQSISPSLYEVSKIEGANKWEEFWFVTIPMLRHIINLVIIYTMIEIFTSVDNPVMKQAYSAMQDRLVYDRSSAMLWGYFAIVAIIIGIVLGCYNHFLVRHWE